MGSDFKMTTSSSEAQQSVTAHQCWTSLSLDTDFFVYIRKDLSEIPIKSFKGPEVGLPLGPSYPFPFLPPRYMYVLVSTVPVGRLGASAFCGGEQVRP